MARKINEAEWEMGEWDHAEAQAWVEMQKGKERLFGEGRWPITRKEAEEAGGALVLVREEVREELDATEKGIGMMAKGMAKSVKDVEKVGERMGKKKEEFVGRWGR